MSSSPTDGVTKSKTKLSLASLLSSVHGEKQSELITSCIASSANLYRGVPAVSSINCKNLPTVANSELLYKSISSSRTESLSQMPPLAPTQPKMVLKKTAVQPISSNNEQIEEIYKQHGFLSYANVNNPLSHIKSLTNTLTVPTTQVSQYKVINTLSTTRPTPACSTTQSHSSRLPISSTAYSSLPTPFAQTISPAPFISNGEMSISTIDTDDSSNYKCEVVCEGNVTSMNIDECSPFHSDLVEELSSFSPPTIEEKKFRASEPIVVVPKGWNRIIEKGAIIYISPNKSRIRSYDDMIEYMEADNTCKCGLECPVRPKELFNFDPKVSSKLGITDFESTYPTERNCNACKEFDILLSTSLAAKRDNRRRRRGRIKSTPEEEEKLPDRKKILLTGASPLEMFQSGMQAINALSGSQFKNYSSGREECTSSKQNSSLVNKFNTHPRSTTMKSMNKFSTPPTNTSSNAQMISNTLPGGSVVTNTALQNIVEFSGQNTSVNDDDSNDVDNDDNENDNDNGNNNNSSNSNSYSNNINNNNSTITPTNALLANAIAFEEQVAHLQTTITSFQPVVSSPHFINSVSRTRIKSPQLSHKQTTSEHITSSTQLHSSHPELNTIAANIINSESANMMLPSSFTGTQPVAGTTKRTSKSTRGHAQTSGQTKKTVKKVLPNVDVKKARELQLSDYLQHPAYSLTQGSVRTPSTEVIPTLKTIHSDAGFVPRTQHASSSSSTSTSASELQNIYKSLHVSVMASQPSNLSSSSNAISVSPCYQSPPPNRTVSSTNQLPEALVNQLGLKYTSATNLKAHNATLPGRTTFQSLATTSNVNSAIQESLNAGGGAVCNTTATATSLNKTLNRPLHNITTSCHVVQNIPPSSNVQHNTTSSVLPVTQIDNGQPIMLLQFVTQNAEEGNATLTKVNAPIVRTYAMPHSQGYNQDSQPKYVLMENRNQSPTHATLAMPNKSTNSPTPQLNSTKQHTVHIQGLIPVQTNASQLHPRGGSVSHMVPHALPVQYVSPPLSKTSQNSEQTFTVMQYIQQTKPDGVSYVFQGNNCTPNRSAISNTTTDYVRIAPAVQSSQPSAVNVYNIEMINKGQQLLHNIQDHIKSSASSVFHPTTSVTSPHSNIEPSISKVTPSNLSRNTSFSLSAEISNQRTIPTQEMVTSVINSSNVQSVYNTARLVPTLSGSPRSSPVTTCTPSSPVVLRASPQMLQSENVVLLTGVSSPSYTMMNAASSSTTFPTHSTADQGSTSCDINYGFKQR